MKIGFALGLILGAAATLFFLLALVAVWDVNHQLVSANANAFLKDVIGPFAAGLGGAAIGALLSSHFQRASDRAKEVDQVFKDYFLGYSILVSKFYELRSTQENAVRPYQDSALRFLDIPSSPGYADIEGRAELVLGPILLQLGFERVMDAIRVCETTYSYCLQNHEQRDTLHSECRELLAEFGGKPIALKLIVKAIGSSRVLRLYSATEGFIEVLDQGVMDFADLIRWLDREVAPKIKQLNPSRIVATTQLVGSISETPPPKIKSKERLEEIIQRYM